MTRRQLAFVVLLNGLISLVIALAVVWLAEQRRPDLAELPVAQTPVAPVVLIITPTSPPLPPTPIPTQVLPPTPTSPPPSTDPQVYIVQPGDSLFGIAVQFGVSMDALMEANNISDPDRIFSGQRLIIPGSASNLGTAGNPETTSPAPTQTVKITLRVESPGDLAQESVLVINDGDTPVNLEGWQLRRPGGPAYLFGNVPLFPGGSVRVHTRAGSADSLNLYWGRIEPVWRSGDTVELVDAQGQVVAQVTVP